MIEVRRLANLVFWARVFLGEAAARAKVLDKVKRVGAVGDGGRRGSEGQIARAYDSFYRV